MDNWSERTELLLGAEAVGRLRQARVAVIGLGGVGAAAAEMLTRAGVGTLYLVDSDTVGLSNVNRQLIALRSTVGRPKTDVLRERLLDINPDARIIVIGEYLDEQSIPGIFSRFRMGPAEGLGAEKFGTEAPSALPPAPSTLIDVTTEDSGAEKFRKEVPSALPPAPSTLIDVPAEDSGAEKFEREAPETLPPDHHSMGNAGGGISYVVDAIDTLSPKIALIQYCLANGIRLVSSMGSGAKMDATRVRIADISKTRQCPLAHMLRKRLHRLGITTGFQAVYSEEIPMRESVVVEESRNKKSQVGTISYLPTVFGCICAQAVIKSIADIDNID